MTNPNSKPVDNAGEKAFLEHLIELRDRLLRIVIAIGIVFLLLTPFVQDLYNWLSDPLIRHLPAGEKLIATGVASPFLVPFKLALMVAFLISLPYSFYQIWGFVAPGLYQHEKKMVTPLLVSSVALFYVGMAFAYFFVIPMIAKAAVAFAPSNVNPTPDIAAYLDFTVAMFLAFGLSFETPVATVLLVSMGVVSVEDLSKARPYIIVGAFVVAMFLTPPDVISQIMMAVPIWFLFEFGLLVSRLFAKKEAETAPDDPDSDPDPESTQASQVMAAGAAAGVATAAAVQTGEDVEQMPGPDDEWPAKPSGAEWDTPTHHFEETGPVQADSEHFKPLTEAEMDAELARIEAEMEALNEQARYAAGAATPPALDTTAPPDSEPKQTPS